MSWPGEGPHAQRLADGRLHLSHGPIDLVIEVAGEGREAALATAVRRFATILDELVGELPTLRRRIDPARPPDLSGSVARRMLAACLPLAEVYLTPMAAVAGSVADEVLAAMLAAGSPKRTVVNNGGDIALRLAAGETLRIGAVRDLALALPEGVIRIDAASGIGGVATSGWRGRSFSLGIADAVTVLAASAAAADAAATLVANAVSAEHPAIRRMPASNLDPDSDLGELPVTTAVGDLPAEVTLAALDRGAAEAGRLVDLGHIRAALLALRGEWRVVQGEPLAIRKPNMAGLSMSTPGADPTPGAEW